MNNYEKYFGSPEKVAESCFGNLNNEMQDACEKWIKKNPLINIANSNANTFKIWLEEPID